MAAPPELVCLCSSSLKWRGRACGLGSETSASARGVSWTYTECGVTVVVPLEVPGGAGVGREAAPLEQLIWGVSCCKAQVVGLLLVVANDVSPPLRLLLQRSMDPQGSYTGLSGTRLSAPVKGSSVANMWQHPKPTSGQNRLDLLANCRRRRDTALGLCGRSGDLCSDEPAKTQLSGGGLK